MLWCFVFLIRLLLYHKEKLCWDPSGTACLCRYLLYIREKSAVSIDVNLGKNVHLARFKSERKLKICPTVSDS